MIQRIAMIFIGGGALTALGFFWWFFRTSLLNPGFRIAAGEGAVISLLSPHEPRLFPR